MRVSEIRVKRIRVNQGLGVLIFTFIRYGALALAKNMPMALFILG